MLLLLRMPRRTSPGVNGCANNVPLVLYLNSGVQPIQLDPPPLNPIVPFRNSVVAISFLGGYFIQVCTHWIKHRISYWSDK